MVAVLQSVCKILHLVHNLFTLAHLPFDLIVDLTFSEPRKVLSDELFSSHFYLTNLFGIVLKSRGPMLELNQGKNSQIVKHNELNMLYNHIQT